ncbi:rab family protein [Clostridium sp. CAG:265]|uniref:immunoglobulin-like domain-containing protein n=1 Tax=Clostridium sp. CAG:265 TaxID=1262787 RepID=UPI00033D5B97|nr:immunoglobulin-like domain-containing protein [Clostridium sp. CAG:265]CDB74105.1 rab family protein [Clostridium sp. CAG:265]
MINYNFEYGDYFEIYHGHPTRFSITGNVTDERENYTDGVQNPENLLNVKFVITESGLKSVYTNPDENKVTNNKVVFGPVAPEKFPFKIQIDFQQKKFKVIETTYTNILNGHSDAVYKMVLIGSNGTIKRETEFLGSEDGNIVMNTTNTGSVSNKNWNNQPFEYDDCLYIWHKQPERSIIKGTISKQREDYSDGVNDPDNMNHVVFRLTETGLKSVYNNAPEIKGIEDVDVYQNQQFDTSANVTYKDDHDNENLTTNISPAIIDTSRLGEQTVTYTATDRWGKTTTVERKVTVRPNLYKNVFKIYPEIGAIQGTTKNGESADGDTLESTTLSETPSTSDTSNSTSTVTKPWDYVENNTRNLAFEIGFDTLTNKYKVYNQTDEKLSNNNLNDVAFTIKIKDANGNEKANITLTGNDRGTSPKLLELNNVTYADDDIIRVYRSDLKGIKITGDINGHIPTVEQMQSENNRFDYMQNTGFKVSNSGLQAIYNKAPVMTGVKKIRTISKGIVDLLDGITLSDDIDNDSISTDYIYIYIDDKLIGTVGHDNSQSYRSYNFDKVGTYKVKYLLYDKWERATVIETTVKVESKVRENEIEVYGPNNLASSENPEFRVAFDTKDNKFVLKGASDDGIVKKEEKEDAEEVKNQESNSNQNNNQESNIEELILTRVGEDNYFEMIVRNIKGEEKVKVSLNGDTEHDKFELNKLHNLALSKYDTISLKSKYHNAVKIKGNVITEDSNGSTIINNSYENGFGTTDKYTQVRFKITDDGLKEMTSKELTAFGIIDKAIKRGDTLDLLEGISVNVNDQNNEDYKITVKEVTPSNSTRVADNETVEDDNSSDDGSQENNTKTENSTTFKKLKEGIYTVKYTITNSWGTSIEKTRRIKVDPRTDLEAVKLSVKDRENNVILVIGFDSIEKKLRVIESKNKSINYLDNNQVFEINAFDSLGKTLGTIALRGSQEIEQTIIDRINNFPYEEGYALSIWAKSPQTTLQLEGNVENDKDNDFTELVPQNIFKSGLTPEEIKIKKMENGRFEILSSGLKYIYNNAPKFEGNTDVVIPYYKGDLLKAPSNLIIKDDHDGEISTTEVTVNDDNVDYDKLGEQQITYVVEDSWGRRAEKDGKIEIKSAMDSNSINIYPKENSTTDESSSETKQEPSISMPEQNGDENSSQTRTIDNEDDSENAETGGNGENANPNPGDGDLGSTPEENETAPGEDGSTNNPGSNEGESQPSPGEGNTPDSGSNGSSENNTDNEVVKKSSFSIKFVREGNKNRIKVETGDQSSKQFDSSKPNEIFVKIKIYDADGTVLKSINILGSDTGEKAKEKIENELNKSNSGVEEETEKSQIKTNEDSQEREDNTDSSTSENKQQFEYFNNQYIAIEGVTEETKNYVKIQGTVVNKEIDYNTGVSNIDKIENVRFKFTDLGLEAVYNKAPIIKIDKDIKLDGTKRNTNSNVEENSSQDTGNVNTEDFDGIKGDDFNYLRGVTISDDHDILTKENVEVKWNDKFVDDTKDYSANEESALTDNADGEFTLAGNGVKVYGEQRVGDNLLYYKVTDSWGRVSYAQRKNIILKNGIFQNKIKFEHQNGGNNLTLNFNKVENSAESDGKVQLNLINNNNNYFASSNADFKYYEIQVWVPDNNSSNEINSGYRNERTLTLKGNQTPGSVQSQINNFNNLQVPYGTILKIYAGHPQLFSIEGPVRNAAEDYSDKVQNPENVVDTVFKITDAGLKAIYVKTEVDKSLRENENLISLVAPEKIPLKIKISPNGSAGSSSNGGSISIVDSNTTWIDSSVEDVVFKMILKHENGQVVKEISISGKDYGDAQSISNQFRDFNYVYGDTLTISHRTPKKVLIKGNIINAREDYSDGVDNSLNLTEAVFKLTPTGLEAVYRSAPQIMGMIDIEVEKGKSIDYEQLKQSVSAKDNIDGFIPKENIQFSAETIDTSIVGMYEFTYTVTNSNQRTTTKSSTITVYDKPTITANSKATIELNSIENTEKAIKDYLKTAVDVNDDDDKLYNKTTKIEVKSTNVNPNNEGRYQATYVATDLYGYSKEETIDIEVVRTINVTVPTKLPFQVITNLIPNENGVQENDGFVSGVLKLKNNNTSPVKVSIESFVKKDGSGELEIVDPEVYDWNNMTIEDSMTKMALGIYVKDNSLTGSDYNDIEDSLWLSSEQHYNTITSDETNTRTGEEANGGSDTDQIGIINKQLGILPAKVTGSTTPAEASIGFTSKHGKNFKGGSVTGKFQLVFKFE